MERPSSDQETAPDAAGTAAPGAGAGQGGATPPPAAPPGPEAPPQRRIMAMARRIWSDWLYDHRRALALNLLLIAVVAGSTALYPVIIQWALDGFEQRAADVIAWAPVAVIVAVVVKSAALYAHRMVTNGALARVDADMQRAMLRTLVHADLSALDREAPAALASRFTTDIAVLREGIERVIVTLIRDGLSVVGLFVSLLYIDWELTLYALIGLPIAAVPIAEIGRRLRRIARRTQEEAARMTARINEGLSGIRLSKTYRLEEYVISRADETFEQQRALKVKATDQKARIDPTLEALAGIGLALVFWVIGARILSGESSIGEFMAFVSAFLIAGQPLRGFGQLYAAILSSSAAAERVYDLLDAEPGISDRPGAADPGRVRGEITLERVGFAYEDGTRALQGVDLHVPAGKRIALVGRSGAGKSTVFNLIPRLYDATEGRVLVDGTDIRALTLAGLRDNVATVSQEAVIFDDTVANNIGFGRPGATRAQIEAAAKAAQAHDFILRLPEGYDSMAGERGGRFSGGERQRLSIARAILRDAPILLLDEATSALDAESEDAIRQALEILCEGRTTLVIAHRLSTVRDADLIVAMDRGRIVETGTHAELLARGGLYADLHRLQFREG